MMNRFFTLLFAASCLTAVGQVQGDFNDDGCVQLEDLLGLLGSYGNCGFDDLTWQCGDPIGYEGYDYQTVLIGEQCWYAENCRYLLDVHGSTNASQWAVTETPRTFIQSEWSNTLQGAMENNWSLEERLDLVQFSAGFQQWGVLYNWYCIEGMQLCPDGWHVPSEEDWLEMENFLNPGLDPNGIGYRGSHGVMLKSANHFNGTNTTNFEGRPGGSVSNGIEGAVHSGNWWTSSEGNNIFQAWHRGLHYESNGMYRSSIDKYQGLSVRCIKDPE